MHATSEEGTSGSGGGEGDADDAKELSYSLTCSFDPIDNIYHGFAVPRTIWTFFLFFGLLGNGFGDSDGVSIGSLLGGSSSA